MDKPDEIFIVVNKNDKITGYHSRFECHHNKTLIHRAVGVVIFNQEGEVLLQKRSKHKDTNPGLYTLSVSGHVNKNDTYEQTAKRELFEELGIISPLKTKQKFIVSTAIETEMVCIFEIHFNGPFSPNKEEIDKIKFVTINKLKQMQPELTSFAIICLKNIGIL